jgi:hypothetical protein
MGQSSKIVDHKPKSIIFTKFALKIFFYSKGLVTENCLAKFSTKLPLRKRFSKCYTICEMSTFIFYNTHSSIYLSLFKGQYDGFFDPQVFSAINSPWVILKHFRN